MFKLESFKNEVILSETDNIFITDIYEQDIISETTLDILLKEHAKSRSKGDITEKIISLGLLTQAQLDNFLFQTYNIERKDIERKNGIPKNFAFLKPEILIKEKFIPFAEDETTVHALSRNLLNADEALKISSILNTSKKVMLFFASESAIEEYLQFTFKERGRLEQAIKSIHALMPDRKNLASVEGLTIKDPIVEFVDALFEEAVAIEAFMIYIEPKETFIKICFKVESGIVKENILQKEYFIRILNRLKILAGMNITENEKPQEGSVELSILSKTFILSFNCRPILFGEAVSIRIIEKNSVILSLEEYGLSKNNLHRISRIKDIPEGIILISGPESSYKEKLFYEFLNNMARNSHIITCENTIDCILPNLSQSMISENIKERAKIALNAGSDIVAFKGYEEKIIEILIENIIKGNKIIATLTAIDSISAIHRFFHESSAKRFRLNTISAVLSQRAVKKLCSDCKEEIRLKSEDLLRLKLAKTDVKNIFIKKGCISCNQTGYKGKLFINEVFLMDNELEELFMEGASRKSILEAAKQKGFTSLFEDARLKVLQGLIDVEEAAYITSI